MQGTGQGCFVFSWDQVELDGLTGAAPASMAIGATWRWSGRAMRVDDPRDVLVLENGQDHAELRARAGAQVRKMFTAELGAAAVGGQTVDALPANGFDLTDGLNLYRAVVLDDAANTVPLVMFTDGVPSPDTDHWVLRQDVISRTTAEGQGMICFVPGTYVDAPGGPRLVEDIHPGDQVLTRDSGAVEVLWRASRTIGGSRIVATPALRPIRIRADLFGTDSPRPELVVSPDHRILLQGPAAQALFNTDEVLVAARDLAGSAGIGVDHRIRPVDYIHLMLDGHQVICANGVDCESFHPASANLGKLGEAERSGLDLIVPQVTRDPMRFGDFARRLLNKAEAAMLIHGFGRDRGFAH